MITPLDIENKKFSKQVVNGYNVEEVDDFLDDLTVDYTKSYKETSELKTKVEELEKSLEHYKTIEDTLQNTLLMAQKTAEDVKNVAKQVVEKNPKDVEDLLNQEAIFEAGKTVNEALVGKIATIGENLTIRRFARFESKGLLESYIHGDGKIAVLINMAKGDKEVAKDLCMQIAAARPEYLNEQAVPAERVEKEKEILKVQTMNEGKPEQIAEKIVQGRIRKFFEEICLVDQVFVKDSNMKVSELLKQKDAEVVEFARFEKGEGIEKKEENFAEEVMNQLK